MRKSLLLLLLCIPIIGCRDTTSLPMPHLAVAVTVDAPSIRAGTVMLVHVTVTNAGNDVEQVDNNQCTPFVITTADLAEVGPGLNCAGFAVLFTPITLQPGESHTFETVWTGTSRYDVNGPVYLPPGRYLLRGRVQLALTFESNTVPVEIVQ